MGTQEESFEEREKSWPQREPCQLFEGFEEFEESWDPDWDPDWDPELAQDEPSEQKEDPSLPGQEPVSQQAMSKRPRVVAVLEHRQPVPVVLGYTYAAGSLVVLVGLTYVVRRYVVLQTT